MRLLNMYQNTTAAKMNAAQILKEDKNAKHIIYGERPTRESPMTIYNNPIIFYHDETLQKYMDTNPAYFLYIIHRNQEY